MMKSDMVLEKYVEYSLVISNFLSHMALVRDKKKYYVFANNVSYKFDDIVIQPDISIVHTVSKRENEYLTAIPLFVMDILSCPSEEKDYAAILDIYNKIGVSECWIVDWLKKTVQIYLFDDDGQGGTKPYLQCVIDDDNKEDLKIIMLQEHVNFDMLFELS